MKAEFKPEVLTKHADLAYVTLSSQVSIALDLAQNFIESLPPDDCSLSKKHQVLDLQRTFKPIASLMTELAEAIMCWHIGRPYMNPITLEMNVLNELLIQIGSLFVFFDVRNIKVPDIRITILSIERLREINNILNK